jgi:hypothetical protein
MYNYIYIYIYRCEIKTDGTSENTAYHNAKQNHKLDGAAREYYDSDSYQAIWLVSCNSTEYILRVMLDLSHSYHSYVTPLFSILLFIFH